MKPLGNDLTEDSHNLTFRMLYEFSLTFPKVGLFSEEVNRLSDETYHMSFVLCPSGLDLERWIDL